MRTIHKQIAFFLSLALVLTLCLFGLQVHSHAQQTYNEGFESGSKTSYAVADVLLSTGYWNLNDALIGTSSTDQKIGFASARVRNTGSVSMDFDVSGAGTVSIQHAIFSSDGSSSWELWYSINGGTSYAKVGSTITTTSTTLATATFTVNTPNAVRFSIRKVSGGTYRLNFDNISISAYAATPPPSSSSEHLTMGNPSNAVANTAYPGNYLLDKPQYAISYNRDLGRPNWVSWHLDTSWLGSAVRQNDFRNDTTLPAGWYQVQATDYTGSGFDRGHHCPSAGSHHHDNG